MAENLWRKMPRSIIRDENLLYISDQLPRELSYAPWMFYYAALSIADDDGIFDLEDGIVFARLMKVGDPKIVFQIANFMMQRNLILRSSNKSTKCILVNWEYKEGAKRSMEARRAVVQKKIDEEKQLKEQNVPFVPQNEVPSVQNSFSVDFSKNPASNFFCDLNDKNQENVAIKNVVDKNCENVVKTEREKERQTEIQERKILEREKETHRATPGFIANPYVAKEEYTEVTENEDAAQQQKEEQEDDDPLWHENCNGTDKSNPMGNREVNNISIQAYGVLKSFFAKNNLGFNENEHLSTLWELAFRIESLSDDRNPVEIVAVNFTEQYKKLVETSEYYNSYPILPEYMLKKGAYDHILAGVSKILMNQNNQSVWMQAIQAQTEYENDIRSVGNEFENQYLKYNIDPQDPNAAMKLLQKLQQKGTDDP